MAPKAWTARQRLVAAAILLHVEVAGSVRAAPLAARLGVSSGAVVRALRRLVADGLLERDGVSGRPGSAWRWADAARTEAFLREVGVR